MKLHQVAGCPFGHRARIVLEEKKLPYEVVYFEPGQRSAALEAVSPDAKSPTLFDEADQIWVWDSRVVMEYLEERYPEVPLMPRDAAGRARVRLSAQETDARLLPTLGPIVGEVAHKPAALRDEGKVREGLVRFRDTLVPWNARLEGKTFLVGDSLTLADVTLFTPLFAIGRLLGKDGDIPDALTHLRAWRDRLVARPSTAY